MSKPFKDFNKDVKDLLGKGIQAPNCWKYESKTKTKKGCDDMCNFALNPQVVRKEKAPPKDLPKDAPAPPTVYETNALVNLEHSCCDVATKVKITPDCTISPEVTYSGLKGHKIKVVTGDVCAFAAKNAGVEIEGEFGKEVAYNFNVSAGGAIEPQLSYKALPQLIVGGGLNFNFNEGKLASYEFGARVKPIDNLFVNVTCKNLAKYTTGVIFTQPIMDKKTTIAAQVDCEKGKCGGKVGVEVDTGLCNDLKVKAVVDDKCAVTLAAGWTFPDRLKAVLSVSSKACCKFGLELTRE